MSEIDINIKILFDKYLIYFNKLKEQYQQLKKIYVLYGGSIYINNPVKIVRDACSIKLLDPMSYSFEKIDKHNFPFYPQIFVQRYKITLFTFKKPSTYAVDITLTSTKYMNKCDKIIKS